jgi:hypothetical protein
MSVLWIQNFRKFIFRNEILPFNSIWPIETQCLPFKYKSDMSLSKQYHTDLMPIKGAKYNDFGSFNLKFQVGLARIIDNYGSKHTSYMSFKT